MGNSSQVQRLLDYFAALGTEVDAGAVLGEPVTGAGRTVIPLTEVTHYVRAGAEEAPESPSSTRPLLKREGHSQTRPLAALEVTPTGVRVRPPTDRRITGGRLLWAAWVGLWLFLAVYWLVGRPNAR
jgi:uncharacterized spore protein YtfJ